eukprot:6322384-Heterocapsa_arctica.AAC.1
MSFVEHSHDACTHTDTHTLVAEQLAQALSSSASRRLGSPQGRGEEESPVLKLITSQREAIPPALAPTWGIIV